MRLEKEEEVGEVEEAAEEEEGQWWGRRGKGSR